VAFMGHGLPLYVRTSTPARVHHCLSASMTAVIW
jgi:hypothetical protein